MTTLLWILVVFLGLDKLVKLYQHPMWGKLKQWFKSKKKPSLEEKIKQQISIQLPQALKELQQKLNNEVPQN